MTLFTFVSLFASSLWLNKGLWSISFTLRYPCAENWQPQGPSFCCVHFAVFFTHLPKQWFDGASPKRKRQHDQPSPKDTSLIIQGKRNGIKYSTMPTTLVHLKKEGWWNEQHQLWQMRITYLNHSSQAIILLGSGRQTRWEAMREHMKRDSIRFNLHESTYNQKFTYDASVVKYQSTKRQFQRPVQSQQT